MSHSYETEYTCPSCGQKTTKNPRPTWSDRYHKAGSHPLIAEYNTLLDDFNAKVKALEARISEAEKAKAEPSPKYGNPTVQVVKECTVWHDSNTPVIEKVRITRYLLNKEEGEARINAFGHRQGGWDESRTSVNYYRTEDGILAHDGGGWTDILKSPALISEEEWTQLKSGTIPERLLAK